MYSQPLCMEAEMCFCAAIHTPAAKLKSLASRWHLALKPPQHPARQLTAPHSCCSRLCTSVSSAWRPAIIHPNLCCGVLCCVVLFRYHFYEQFLSIETSCLQDHHKSTGQFNFRSSRSAQNSGMMRVVSSVLQEQFTGGYMGASLSEWLGA